jgi:hypothetical protein
MEAIASLSKIGFHLIPPEVDFHRPPDAVPAYIISGLECTTSIEVTRPDMPPGPMFRGVLFLRSSIENSCVNPLKLITNNKIVRMFFIVMCFLL